MGLQYTNICGDIFMTIISLELQQPTEYLLILSCDSSLNALFLGPALVAARHHFHKTAAGGLNGSGLFNPVTAIPSAANSARHFADSNADFGTSAAVPLNTSIPTYTTVELTVSNNTSAIGPVATLKKRQDTLTTIYVSLFQPTYIVSLAYSCAPNKRDTFTTGPFEPLTTDPVGPLTTGPVINFHRWRQV